MSEPGNYQLIRDTVKRLAKNVSYLEIGTCEGGSAAAAFSTDSIRLAVLIDTWGIECGGSGKGSPDHVVKLLGDAMRSTIIITGESKAVLPTLTHQFDLIFVDGDHSHEGCLSDMTNSLRLLAPGGIMLVDDLDNGAHTYLRKTVTDFAAANGLDMVTHAVHCGVAELRRKV